MTSLASNQANWLREVELIDAAHEANEQITSQALLSGIFGELREDLEKSVDWFLNQMPPLYHLTTTSREKTDHVIEIVAGRVVSHQQVVERVDTVANKVTIIAPGENNGTAKVIARLTRYPAKNVQLFNSRDAKVTICSVSQSAYSTSGNWWGPDLEKKKALVLKALANKPAEAVEAYLSSLDAEYARNATLRMITTGFEATEWCQANENTFVNLTTHESDPASFAVDVGLKGFPINGAIEYIVGVFTRYNFNVRRLLCQEIRTADNQLFTVIQVLAATQTGEAFSKDMRQWGRVLKGLKSLAYVDHGDEFATLLQGQNPRSINEANLLRAMANWSHIFLTKVNPYYYSLDRVSKAVLRNEAFMEKSIQYFRAKFDPRFDGDRNSALRDISTQIEALFVEIPDEVERNILREGFNFLQHVLKTNYFVVSKGALSFRMDPKALNKQYYPDTPFGIFYIIGRDIRGFQVRYRDIARGGVRVVMPRNSGDYDNALAGLFDEVNGLASAQQMKNKDIPEGGSKAVFVVRPGGSRHLGVKSAVSGLLDLITVDQNGKLADGIIDWYGKEEVIYLGPDENLTDDLIVWIIQHALKRGYKYAYSFMSSKPDFGINHKTYGVTSEGINVYVDNVLRYLKLNGPNTRFRVKLTGGPSGDVAGNELKILHREYGERCRVVAISDGYGAAYDPNGLDWKELLRLVAADLSINHFNAAALSDKNKAWVLATDSKENWKRHDALCMEADAEVFIPGGGRPYTIKENNWNKFLKADGKPTMQAVVEGANIFFTAEARKKIMESGVVVIKDSSANKTGVICSSFEIIACLTIKPEEFAAIKTTYVAQVLDILRTKADLEAKLLFSEWQKRQSETNLVQLSYDISKEINYAKDVVRERLNSLTDAELNSDKFSFILFQHCPQILVEKYRERIVSLLPRAHKIAILSAYMASRLVYKEGLNWLENLEPEQVFRIALDYVDAEQAIEKMIADVQGSSLAAREQIASILRGAGAKHLASARN